MFIISLNYIKPIEEVELHLEMHVEFLKNNTIKRHLSLPEERFPEQVG